MAPNTSAKASYRKRVKSSNCRGLMRAKCRTHANCKMTSGKKRQYCRKLKNTRRVKAAKSAKPLRRSLRLMSKK